MAIKPQTQDPKVPENERSRFPTLGGFQFWTDQFVFGDWRIQQHVYTRHCRLLDDRNFRRASGTYNECRKIFEKLRSTEPIPDLSPTVVVMLHGLARTRGSMNRLAKHFRQKKMTPINIGYASTRAPIHEHAKAFNRVICQLEGVKKIHFVAHSMGNIVWRYYLHYFRNQELGYQGDPRIASSVMIAPPNQGAQIARFLKPTGIFGLITGKSGLELASPDWASFTHSLATPNHPFGIIAGKYNLNPIFRTDNDTTVSVEETKLAGAADFQIVRAMHTTIMANPKVIQMVDTFFEHGYLVSEESRQRL